MILSTKSVDAIRIKTSYPIFTLYMIKLPFYYSPMTKATGPKRPLSIDSFSNSAAISW